MPLVNGGAISTKAKFKNQKGLLACPAVQSLPPRAGSYLHFIIINYLFQ
jgi:hypothetical protein